MVRGEVDDQLAIGARGRIRQHHKAAVRLNRECRYCRSISAAVRTGPGVNWTPNDAAAIVIART